MHIMGCVQGLRNSKTEQERIKKMNQRQFEKILNHVIDSIESAGYEAENQIVAYALTGDDCYITRRGDAREWIHKLDIEQIKDYYEL